MLIKTNSYVTACPVGCNAPLEATTLNLPEGPLRRCTGCGQLLSVVDEARYHLTMQAFNAPDFNQPPPREVERRRSVARRRLQTVSRLLNTRVRHQIENLPYF
jgi:hypothetical protein